MYQITFSPKFESWLTGLSDRRTRIRLSRRLDRARRGLLGDTVSVGQGVFEMREHFGPGWRMYYGFRGRNLLLMLAGGTKTSQRGDIDLAIALQQTIEE
jgi:hypothetical protein